MAGPLGFVFALISVSVQLCRRIALLSIAARMRMHRRGPRRRADARGEAAREEYTNVSPCPPTPLPTAHDLISLPSLPQVLAFGSNFVVTKKYKTGDGLFFSWCLASGIFLFGIFTFIVQCNVTCSSDSNGMPSCSVDPLKTCPIVSPFAMLGGVFWAFGNVMVVPIVKTIGLSLGEGGGAKRGA